MCSECCSMTDIHRIHHCAYLGNGAQFFLGEEWLILLLHSLRPLLRAVNVAI